jgi:putative DNA primase/helicase
MKAALTFDEMPFTKSVKVKPDYVPPVPNSEDSLAVLFVQRHGESLRYVASQDRWMEWTGKLWQQEDTLLSFERAREIAKGEADALRGDPKTQSLARSLVTAGTIAAVTKIAKADRAVAATTRQWDKNLMQLNTPDGIIDLTTGKVLPHDRKAYCSKITMVGPSKDRPVRWLKFLDEIFPERDIIDFLQRALGYALTGLTIEEKMLFFHGCGRNGKGTLLHAVSGILGEYAKTAGLDTFTETYSDKHPEALACLQGARLVTVSETKDNARWDESLLKTCTGSDPIRARFMRQNSFEFKPSFKLIVSGNNRPKIQSVDTAMRRRMLLVPFDVIIADDKCNQHLGQELMEEWPSILHWIIEGCLEWQRIGLAPPESVTIPTTQYLDSEDRFGRWLKDRCHLDPDDTMRAAEGFKDWLEWCEQENERNPGSQIRFSRTLTERGFRQKIDMRGSTYYGLSLLSDRPEAYRTPD